MDDRRKNRWPIEAPDSSSVRIRARALALVASSHSDIAQLIAPRFSALSRFSLIRLSKRCQKMLLSKTLELWAGISAETSILPRGLFNASSMNVFSNNQTDSSRSIHRTQILSRNSCLQWKSSFETNFIRLIGIELSRCVRHRNKDKL